MTAKACPAPEALLDLLAGPPAASPTASADGLRAHVTECAACTQQLQSLQQAFDAMGPAEGPVAAVATDAPTLQRVQERVLTELAAAHSGLRWRGALAALAILLSVGGWLLLRGHTLTSPIGMALAAVPLLAVLLLGAAPSWQRVGLALTLGVVSAVLLSSSSASWVPLWSWSSAACLSLWLSGVVGPALVLRSVALPPGSSALRGALLGVAVFAGGATVQRTLCGLGGLWHLVGFHLLPWLLGVAALAALAAQLRSASPTEEAA